MTKKSLQPFTIKSVSRRSFLKKSALGTLGLSLSGKLSHGFPFGPDIGDPPPRSRVVLVRHSGVIDETGKIEHSLLQEMLDTALTKLSGKSTIADAWREYIRPEDVVGLKVNTLGLMDLQSSDLVQHFPGMITAVTTGLKKAGVQDKNIIVWDRSDEEIKTAGLTIQRESGRMRIMGNKQERRGSGGDYTTETYAMGDKNTHLSRILTETCTAVINMPIPKTHGTAGFTCALKNQYGCIDNAGQFHANGCTSPGIAEVNIIPEVRDKQRLVVCDALLIAYEGGPRWRRSFIHPVGGILVGTDPVAVDAVALEILDQKRKAENMEPVAPLARHIPLSAKLGLGVHDLDSIDLIKVDMG